MASLTAHLRRPDDHGRLAFHPECPLCRGERLVGALPSDAVVGRRTQAMITAGVLALSSASPTMAIAAEPDQEQEGAATPEQVAVEAPASNPSVDPGGRGTDLPFEARQAPTVQAAPDLAQDAGPVEQEPVTNQDAPVADSGDGSGIPVAPAPDAVPPPTAPSAPLPESPATTPEQSDSEDPTMSPDSADPTTSPDPAEPTPPPAEAPTGAPTADAPRAAKPRTGAPDRERNRHASPTPSSAPGPTPAAVRPSTREAPTAESTPITVQVAPPSPNADAASRRAGPSDHSHVVEPGESLWSIARDLLGDQASTARIAREVNRLWELNSERIRTGDRDLLLVGTRLALR